MVQTEGRPSTILFAMLVTAAIGAALVLLTRRLLFATTAVAAMVAIISVAAALKRHVMNMVLHAYDVVFYLSSPATISYLWQDYRFYGVSAVCALMAAAAACWIAYSIDGTRIRRRWSGAVTLVLVACAWIAANAVGERRHSQFEYEGQYISSFYQSWSETIETLWRGHLIEAAAAAQMPPFRLPVACTTEGRPPHIILIHHESVVPPSLFPTLRYDIGVDPFFRSDDGHAYGLRVETYGGASSLTEFSVLTGLSTYSFGGMRQFIQSVMAGKVRDTLPQALTRCGYRNVVFYPMLKSFVFTDKFFAGVGLHEIFDLKHQKAKVVNERDRFYYANAMTEIGRHIAVSDRPIFTFIETMATHWPYHVPYMPEVEVPGGGPGTDPEMHEYLRRLSMAHADYDFLRTELARRFPGEPFLIVRYGDHHPMATRQLLGYAESTEAEDVLLDRDSIGFVTFFALNGVNYTVKPLEIPRLLDVPYLGTVMQKAAGLPLSEAHAERRRLMTVCEGRYYGCAERELILAFHKRLIDSGLLDSR